MGNRCGYTSGISGYQLATACNCHEGDGKGSQWLDPTSKCELLLNAEDKSLGFDLMPKTCKVFASEPCKKIISDRVDRLKERERCLKSNTPYKQEYELWVNTMNSCSVP